MNEIFRFITSPGMILIIVICVITAFITLYRIEYTNSCGTGSILVTIMIPLIIILGLIIYDAENLQETPISIESYEIISDNTIRYTNSDGDLKETSADKVTVKQGETDELIMTIIETDLFRSRYEIVIYEPIKNNIDENQEK